MIARVLLFFAALPLLAAKQPNILWISIEDTGQEVAPYDLLADTANIGRLAGEGVTFLNAFSHAPVCAPTRSAPRPTTPPSPTRWSRAMNRVGSFIPSPSQSSPAKPCALSPSVSATTAARRSRFADDHIGG
jgi:hypothetical protein